MPTIGLGEFFLIALIGLVVLGPEELPVVARNIGIWLHNLKTNATVLKDDLLGREGDEK